MALWVVSLVACPTVPLNVEGDDIGECADGVDNDEDGTVDCADEGCAAAADCTGGPPAGAVATITPAEPLTGDDLLCSLEEAAVDPEGTEVTSTFGWLLDGEPTAFVDPAIPASATTRGDVWTCQVVASDEDGEVAEPAEASVAIGNTPPTGPSVQILPDQPQVTDQLTCEVAEESTDEDDDPITYFYQWFQNGVPAGPSDSTLPPVHTQAADEWICQVTPSDGFHSGPTGEASVQVRVDSFPHVTSGAHHSCAVQVDGSYACWGDNTSGQADGPMESFFLLVAVEDFTCGLRFSDTTMDCWGDVPDFLDPIPDDAYVDFAATGTHGCAVTASGHVDVWGTLTSVPDALPGTPRYAAAVSADNSCSILLDDGSLAWWTEGLPLEAPEGSWHDLDSGPDHYCAAGDLGLHCWGDDTWGQVSGTPTDPGPWSQVSAGWRHSCAIETNTGFVTCWGDDTCGQASPPTDVFVQVSAGNYHTCAKRPDDSVECWGCLENDSGQCSPDF